MKKMLEIFRIDWQRIYRSKTAMFLIIALMILPSLYAWFNIKALWDPYHNTAGIKIAVTNDDKGANIQGEQINIGADLIKELKHNDALGWTFVTKETADKGVENGTYYASLYIPADFSEKLASILDDHPEKPEVIYTVNNKINAITPKMASAGASSITQKIASEFVKTVSEKLLTTFNDIGIELDHDLPSIRRLEEKLFEVRDHLPQINEFGEEAITLEEKLPTIKEKANKVTQLEANIPALNDTAQSVLKAESALPLLHDVGSQVLLVQNKIPELRKMAKSVNELNDNFGTVQTTVNDGITEAKQALDVINRVEQYLPTFEELGSHASGYIETANSLVNTLDQSSETIINSIKLGLQTVNQVSGTVANLTSTLEGLEPAQQKEILQQISKQLAVANSVIERQITLLETINDNLPAPVLSSTIEQLTSLQTLGQQQKTLVDNGLQLVDSNPNGLQDIITQINNNGTKIQQTSGNILTKYDSDIVPAFKKQLSQLKEDVATASKTLTGLQEQLPKVEAILTSTKGTLTDAIDFLTSFQASLPELETTLNHATQLINENLEKVITEVNTAATFYQQDFPSLESKIHTASSFVQNDLPQLESDLQDASNLIETKLPQLEEAITFAANFARNDLDDFNDAVIKATDKINEFKKDASLEDLVNM